MSNEIVIPSDFKWVEARAKCTSGVVFAVLKQQVREDVNARIALMKPGESERCFLSLVDNGSSFMVVLECDQDRIYRVAKFTLTPNGVSAYDAVEKLIFNATVTLSNDGQCRLKINDQELELWQVRRLALEDLFFGARP